MDRRTFNAYGTLISLVAAASLSACNDTGFSLSTLGKKELDSYNPVRNPSSNPEPTLSPVPTPTSNPSPTPTLSPEPTPTIIPSPTPTVVPSPTPTVVVPSPTPTSNPSPTPTLKVQVDEFNAPEAQQSKVDMLFCVDNSGSMADKQKVLANSVDTFIGQFVARGIDFHIAVVSTDVTSTASNYWTTRLPDYVQPNRGRLLSRSSDRYLASSSKNVVAQFKANAKVGTSGSGVEQCFGSMLYALNDSNIGRGGFNEHFVREDALLSMIVVSDEDEAVGSDSAFSGETVDGLIKRMKDRIAEVKGKNSRGYSFDFVVNTTAKKPITPVVYPLNSGAHYYPNFYFAAAEAFVGKTYDVLKNFGADLAKIGGDIINQAEREYKLSSKAVEGSIVVKLDNDVIAADSKNGYTFHADRNTIELVGDAFNASPGAKVSISYQFLSL